MAFGLGRNIALSLIPYLKEDQKYTEHSLAMYLLKSALFLLGLGSFE